MRGNLKAERARLGLSERQVAEKIGVHMNQVSRWELGLAEPSGTNLMKLARLFDCAPDYLLVTTNRHDKTPRQTRIEKSAVSDSPTGGDAS